MRTNGVDLGPGLGHQTTAILVIVCAVRSLAAVTGAHTVVPALVFTIASIYIHTKALFYRNIK